MKIKGLLYTAAAAGLVSLGLSANVQAEPPYHGLTEQEREEVRARWDQMSPEEREQVRQKAQDYWAGLSEEERAQKREELRKQRGEGSRAYNEWAQMTPEERQARREEMRARWEQMTPEERRAHRAKMRSPGTGDPGKREQGKHKAHGKDKAEQQKDSGADE
jgi:hypothetical protein